jgi:hypothetical protein
MLFAGHRPSRARRLGNQGGLMTLIIQQAMRAQGLCAESHTDSERRRGVMNIRGVSPNFWIRFLDLSAPRRSLRGGTFQAHTTRA